MAKDKYPMTPGIRLLKSKKIDFEVFQYDYKDKGGTAQTAVELNVEEHQVIKTLVMENDKKEIFIVLMHGDKSVSTKELARQLGCKKVEPANAKTATNTTGYQFGGTSPFGTRKAMKVYTEDTILDLDRIYINGGKQGFIVGLNPQEMSKVLDIEKVQVAIDN